MASFLPIMSSTPRAASSALGGAMKGAHLALTRSGRTNLYARSPSSKLPSMAKARLLSTYSSTSVKNNDSTRAGKNGSQSSQPTASNHQTPPPDDFKISFRDLGMNRVTKFVVYAVIGVISTMETIFWCKALWRWWTGSEEKNE